MKLKQLSEFVAVADYGSFNSASKKLFISQSALSSSVASLESELGFALLERRHDGVVLTPMGVQVLTGARELLKDANDKKAAWISMYQRHTSCKGQINVVTAPGVYLILTKLVGKKFAQIYPNIKLKISERRNKYIYDSIISGKADIAVRDIIYGPDTDKKPYIDGEPAADGFKKILLRSDNYKIAINEESLPAARTDSISKDDIRSMPLACYADGDSAAEMFMEKGFDPDNILEFNSIEKIVESALDGESAACLPEYTIRRSLPLWGYKEELRFMKADGLCIPFGHFLYYRKKTGMEEAISDLVDLIREEFEKQP